MHVLEVAVLGASERMSEHEQSVCDVKALFAVASEPCLLQRHRHSVRQPFEQTQPLVGEARALRTSACRPRATRGRRAPSGSGATASRPSSSSSGLRKSSLSSAESTRRGADDTSMNVSAARRGSRVSHIALSIGVSRQPEQARHTEVADQRILEPERHDLALEQRSPSPSRSRLRSAPASSRRRSHLRTRARPSHEPPPAEGSRRAVHSRATPPRSRRAPPRGAGRSRRTARCRASRGRRRP